MSSSYEKLPKGNIPCAFSPLPTEEPCVIDVPGEAISSEAGVKNQWFVRKFARTPRPKREISGEECCNICMFCMGLLMLFGFTSAGFFLFLKTRLYQPVTMHPKSFSLSNYEVNWEADFLFGCQDCNEHLDNTKIHYDYVKAYISYNEIEDAFSEVSIKPFGLGAMEHKKVHVKSGKTGSESNQPIERKDVDGIGQEAKWELVHLTMRLDVDVSGKPLGLFQLTEEYSFCWKLLVGVMPATGGGRLVHYAPTTCHYDENY